MALYDHRSFGWKGEWWVAEVHSASGAGWTTRPALTDERVIFTCLSNKDAQSRTARIPAGLLNRMTHSSLGRLLDHADSFESRFDLSPSNAPDADELKRYKQIVDDEQLAWALRPTDVVIAGSRGPVTRPAIEAICLDDSALSAIIPLQDMSTLQELEKEYGDAGLLALMGFVKSRYEDYTPEAEDW